MIQKLKYLNKGKLFNQFSLVLNRQEIFLTKYNINFFFIIIF